MADMVRPELQREKDRWGGTIPQWERMVKRLHNFATGRAEKSVNSLCSALRFTPEEKEFYFGDLIAEFEKQ